MRVVSCGKKIKNPGREAVWVEKRWFKRWKQMLKAEPID